ncbi:hypothetical protein ACT6QH_00275 [Xanthobacter sp. TB0139]|uniref:hypothetical protein n=1 Tax=Xanthobacter sp. TB0139 TaxID=3459178 RepID=UPI00403A43D5
MGNDLSEEIDLTLHAIASGRARDRNRDAVRYQRCGRQPGGVVCDEVAGLLQEDGGLEVDQFGVHGGVPGGVEDQLRDGLLRLTLQELTNSDREAGFVASRLLERGGRRAGEGGFRDGHFPVLRRDFDVEIGEREKAESGGILSGFDELVVIAVAQGKQDAGLLRGKAFAIVGNEEVDAVGGKGQLAGAGTPRVLDHLVQDGCIVVGEVAVGILEELGAESGGDVRDSRGHGKSDEERKSQCGVAAGADARNLIGGARLRDRRSLVALGPQVADQRHQHRERCFAAIVLHAMRIGEARASQT